MSLHQNQTPPLGQSNPEGQISLQRLQLLPTAGVRLQVSFRKSLLGQEWPLANRR